MAFAELVVEVFAAGFDGVLVAWGVSRRGYQLVNV